MKKVLFTVVITICSIIVHAQKSFNPLRFDLALGYAVPGQSGNNGGVVFGLEPKYALNGKINLGLRLELAMISTTFETDRYIVTPDAKGIGSLFATGDYYIGAKKIKPFIGLGFGIVRIPSAKFSPNNVVISGNEIIIRDLKYDYSMNMAFMPRVGVERGRLRVAMEYNIMGKTGEIDNKYLGIKLGFFFGESNDRKPSFGNSGRVPIR